MKLIPGTRKTGNWNRIGVLATVVLLTPVLSVPGLAGNGTRQRDASGAVTYEVEFVETTMIDGVLGAVGSGSYLDGDTVFHSGELVEMSNEKVALRYGDEVHDFAIGAKTRFCVNGALSASPTGFEDVEMATVTVSVGSATANRVYRRPLLFKLSQRGAEFVPYGCAAGGSAPGRELVREIQELLIKLGYDPGPVDGYTGPRTRRAIQAFESDEKLEPSGAANEELLDRLKMKIAGKN